ncbi:hypothetical protein HR12_28175 [Microbacterium sp. SUBG005]|nr:hypothetical protein HR12_28175 [Microbacterium sp. SUBG005]
MFPDAAVRILLTAAPEVRAARRSAELTDQDAAKVAAALHKRDAADSTVVRLPHRRRASRSSTRPTSISNRPSTPC